MRRGMRTSGGRAYTAADFCAVVCAYGESPYLDACIRSLLGQRTAVRIVLSTSTPNAYIHGIARRYSLPVYAGAPGAGIAGDWEYALRATGAPLVLLAHQDDLYHKDYTTRILRAANQARDPILFFTDYGERRGTRTLAGSRLLRIKRLLLAPLRLSGAAGSIWIRRRVLSLGSPICCPSVTYVTSRLPEPLFDPAYHVSLDWAAWERLSRLPGSYVYLPQILMLHRIHEGSETTRQIADAGRSREDLAMYRKFWPGWIAALLEHFYSGSEASNQVSA